MTTINGPQPQARRKAPGIGASAAAAILALGLAAAGAQAAPVVSFTAQDIADLGTGDDWMLTYTIGGTADPFESVNLLFDSALYADLVPGMAPADLMLLETQPDPSLLADGQVTATLLAALTAPTSFSVSFTWLGSVPPGAQPYEYLDANFSRLDTGTTRGPGVVAVPEPPMLSAALALAGLATWVRRRKAAARG